MARKGSYAARILIALIVILAVIWLPLGALINWIKSLLPGARHRAARHQEQTVTQAAQDAADLIAAIAPDRPDLLRAVDGVDDPWNDAIDQLVSAARLGVIDWRAEPDELRTALEPMLQRHGVEFDWSFIDELVARGDWEAINNEKLVPRIGRDLSKRGVVLAHIDEGSDAYMMAVCTLAEFAKIDGRRFGRGAIRIRRFG